MRIESPDPEPLHCDDYDFTFTNGLLMSLSVIEDLGDTVDFKTSPMAALFHFSEKPSPTDPESKIPSEDITIMMGHVLSIAKRSRKVLPPTREQQELFRQVLLPASKTVQ